MPHAPRPCAAADGRVEAMTPASGRPTGARRRGRPVDHTGEQTRAEVMAAAKRLFGQGGYRAVSMEALAADCGVDARTLYHHFGSKRSLFEAARDEALETFGRAVLEKVFSQSGAVERLDSYIEVWRALHETDPAVLPFIGMVLLDGFAGQSAERVNPEGNAAATDAALRLFLETLVDDAIAHGELHPDLDREGALLLLRAIGMGLALASLEDPDTYPAMLDTLRLLLDGKLFTARKRRPLK